MLKPRGVWGEYGIWGIWKVRLFLRWGGQTEAKQEVAFESGQVDSRSTCASTSTSLALKCSTVALGAVTCTPVTAIKQL